MIAELNKEEWIIRSGKSTIELTIDHIKKVKIISYQGSVDSEFIKEANDFIKSLCDGYKERRNYNLQ